MVCVRLVKKSSSQSVSHRNEQLKTLFATLVLRHGKNYNRLGGFVPVFQYRILIRNCCNFYLGNPKMLQKIVLSCFSYEYLV